MNVCISFEKQILTRPQNRLWRKNSVQCLNIGGTAARCGIVGDRNYDFPKNGVGTALPNSVQATYQAGSLIDLDVILTAHHKGHFVYKVSQAKICSCFANKRKV